jgi:hypothetical protein
VAAALVAACPAAAPARAEAQQSINSLVTDARSELERMNEFGRLESQSRQMLKDGRFAEARRIAMRALDLNVSNRRAKLLLGDIDAAEKAATPAPAREPAIRRADREADLSRGSTPAATTRADRGRAAPEAAGRGTQAVREVVRAYLSGEYAAALTASAAAGDSAPPRVWLYAACSEASLGLLDAREADARFARARELYAKAQASGASFAADRRVISPRVWDVLATP